ncbi:hypothetical protein [Endothiovibrio diazotrophicus]
MGQRKQILQASRTAAKAGMAASMATLVYTGFRGRKAMGLHTWAGMALLGFTLWHVYLYQPKSKAATRRHAQQKLVKPKTGAPAVPSPES